MFTAGEMFTALALFNQLAVCLSVFPVTLPILIKGLVSRNRSSQSALKSFSPILFYFVPTISIKLRIYIMNDLLKINVVT